MKPSKYNICLPYDDKYVIFNGVTKRFFLVSSQNKEAFMQILSAPDDFQEQYAPFLKRMSDEGFIINDDVDEFEVIRQQYERMNHGTTYKLMILPTYACNVNCWYCTQEHRNLKLSDDDVKRIKAHIEYYLTHNNIERLQLSWFGGEPLLNFSRIEEISTFAQIFCKDHGIMFHNTITTNGLLLNRCILDKMKKLDFIFFQITVDGIKEEHDRVKVIKGKSAYETTLHNICLIAEILPNAEICLRYNYSIDNLNPKVFVEDLNSYLPEKVRKHIVLSLMKVWQEDEEKIEFESIKTLVNKIRESGYMVNYGSGFTTCYVENNHFNCIFPNGLVDKCDNIEPNSCKGHIKDNGAIVWDQELIFPQFTVFDYSDTECSRCKFLPLCYGPCPRDREIQVVEQRFLQCRYNNASLVWMNNIYIYCQNFQNNH